MNYSANLRLIKHFVLAVVVLIVVIRNAQANPTSQPSAQPSIQPSIQPSTQPSAQPTLQPVSEPTTQPTSHPSQQLTTLPTGQPSRQPSVQPSGQPKAAPSSQPSSRPTTQPSSTPSQQPTSQPTIQPSKQPSTQPTQQPSVQPSSVPSNQPSLHPTLQPSIQPTLQPTNQPTTQPSSLPSGQPTLRPSSQPSSQPSASPTVQPSGQPSQRPSLQPSTQPTTQPTSQPSIQPSKQPSPQPTQQPSVQPSSVPSNQPSSQPTLQPSNQPTLQPTNQPTIQPSSLPSGQPTLRPSSQPSSQPSASPTVQPSGQPSQRPSSQPSTQPTTQPTSQPSIQPSKQPSPQPTQQPSVQPSSVPSNQPSSQPTLQPSNQPTLQPTNQPTIQPSSLPSGQPTLRPSSQPSSQPSASPTVQPSDQPSQRPSSQPSTQPTTQPTSQPSIQPSKQPSTQPTQQPSVQPSSVPSNQPSSQPTLQPSNQPTLQPTNQPTTQPSSLPSGQPTSCPSAQPSSQPSVVPTFQPSVQPTEQPTSQPSTQPSSQPSRQPTQQPSNQPTLQPSNQPTMQPSALPTNQPTSGPSSQPSAQPSVSPTVQPSMQPTKQPTSQPSMQPSSQPSRQPTQQPTKQPTAQPSMQPSSQPSFLPSTQPSTRPSVQPSDQPTSHPSVQPSAQPTEQPTCQPTRQPTLQPSAQPSSVPSAQPSVQPSGEPSGQPSARPTTLPSSQPSGQPSTQPSAEPSSQPTAQPSGEPSVQPSEQPSQQPSTQPTSQPSTQPTQQPSSQPSYQPSVQPSSQPSQIPTVQPSTQPTNLPSAQPTEQPSKQPSGQPSFVPSAQPSRLPSGQPTGVPTAQPSVQPSTQPSHQPSGDPTAQPTNQPTLQPTQQPTSEPSDQPTAQPSSMPSLQPSIQPTAQPSRNPTSPPSSLPSGQPSTQPSSQPSAQPSTTPSVQPTTVPTGQPSSQPTSEPSGQPTMQPSQQPTAQPSAMPSSQPSVQPTSAPSSQPSNEPSAQPSVQPTSAPSFQPSSRPTTVPSAQPSGEPTVQPTAQPSNQPTAEPSAQPSTQPTIQPTSKPTAQPSSLPSALPSSQPSRTPSAQPSLQPTTQPTDQPSSEPSGQPSQQPTALPSSQPSGFPTAQPVMHPTSRPSGQPSSEPSSQPSAQPSTQPSGQPVSSPTGQPSRQPSAQPSRQPSRQPSGQPSSRPTTAKQVEISFKVSQVVRASSKAQFLADPKASNVFKATIVSLVPGIVASNIVITNVTDVFVPNNGRIAAPEASSAHRSNDNMVLFATIAGINIQYTVAFVAQRVLVQNSDPAEAYNSVSSQLSTAVQSGSFTTSLQALSAASNSTALRVATSEPGSLAVATTFTTVIVRSAKPTSQPSGQPSGYPSRQPTGQPSNQPTSQPSMQPSSLPTAQPSSAPTLTIETKWEYVVAAAFTDLVTVPQPHRTSYYSMDVSGSDVYGSCESWNTYLASSLRRSHESKEFESLSLIVKSGEVDAAPQVITCSDPSLSRTLIRALASPLLTKNATALADVAITCDAHRWVVQDCYSGDSHYSVQHSATAGGEVSRALCVDCESPCAQYDCGGGGGGGGGFPGSAAVLSPCTREANCPYLQGSLQIFTGYYSDRHGAGYNMVLAWIGAVWGFIILSVLCYNRLIINDMDWKILRSVPKLSFRRHNLNDVKKANFKSIVPEPAMPVGSRPGTSRSIHTATTRGAGQNTGVHDIQIIVTSLLDRLLISAEWSADAYGASESVAVTQRFWYRMVSYNHYLAPYSRPTQRERFVHGLNVLTRVSWLFFCVALCLWFNYGHDDESCYDQREEQECGERKNYFNSNEEYCAWVGVEESSGFSDGGQAVHQTQCVWHLYTGSVETMLNILIVAIIATGIPRIFYTNFLVEGLLLAPGGVKNMFSLHSSRPSLLGSLRFMRKVGIVDDGSAGSSSGSGNKKGTSTSRARSPQKGCRDATSAAAGGSSGADGGGSYDARFLSLALANDKGGISYLESGDASEDSGMMLFRSFLFDFTKYKNAILSMENEKSLEFAEHWRTANPYLFNTNGSLVELTEEFDDQVEHYAHKKSINEELTDVAKSAEKLSVYYKAFSQHDPDQFAVRLLVTFFADLLGRETLQCRMICAMLHELLQDNVSFRDVCNWVKLCAILFILATNICLVYGSIAVLADSSRRRQWYWVIAAAVAVGVDMVLVEGLEALWFRWALPLCVSDSLAALKGTVLEVLDRFQPYLATPQQQQALFRPNSAVNTNAHTLLSPSSPFFLSGPGSSHQQAFSMPTYQFISTNIAHRFPKHIASRIVLSYESVYPRTITSQRWPGGATPLQMLFGGKPWSSGLGTESVGYVLFSNAAMWVAVLSPRFLQQIVLTGLVSLAIWLVSLLVFCLLRGLLLAVYICSGVIGTVLLAALFYRFSWDHDSEHYLAGVQPLRIVEAERNLRPPASAQRSGTATSNAACTRKNIRPVSNLGVGPRHDSGLHLLVDHFPEPPATAEATRGAAVAVNPRSPSSAERHRAESPHRPGSSSIGDKQTTAALPAPQRPRSSPRARPGSSATFVLGADRPLTAGSINLSYQREEYYLSSSSASSADERDSKKGDSQ